MDNHIYHIRTRSRKNCKLSQNLRNWIICSFRMYMRCYTLLHLKVEKHILDVFGLLTTLDQKPVSSYEQRWETYSRVMSSSPQNRIVFDNILELTKNGTICIRAGYRDLYAVAVCNSYPLQRTDQWIDSLEDTQLFSTLHASSTYYLLKVYDWKRVNIANFTWSTTKT